MNTTQPQANQKHDEPSKPIVVDNKTDVAKPANTPASKPVEAAKSGNA